MDLGSWSRRSVVHTRSTLEGDRTPLGNGETVQATLVVAGGDVGKAKKPTVQLDGVALPKFGSGNHTIFRPLAYGQSLVKSQQVQKMLK